MDVTLMISMDGEKRGESPFVPLEGWEQALDGGAQLHGV